MTTGQLLRRNLGQEDTDICNGIQTNCDDTVLQGSTRTRNAAEQCNSVQVQSTLETWRRGSNNNIALSVNNNIVNSNSCNFNNSRHKYKKEKRRGEKESTREEMVTLANEGTIPSRTSAGRLEKEGGNAITFEHIYVNRINPRDDFTELINTMEILQKSGGRSV